jgi:hypothetical protein
MPGHDAMGSRARIETAPEAALPIDRIVLPATDGAEPRAPVRIYVGTEPAQFRALRVFVWSIERVRNPTRSYEINLLVDLPGFDRSRWLTGFTNFRFAIPHLAGGQGRAIYNDVDQIYLSDPGELFDTEMGDCGYLSINGYDTSVMLIDTARMSEVWPLDAVRVMRRKRIEALALEVDGLWGPFDRGWNSRDSEYTPSSSKCVHFTTIHTQPWMPFPDRHVYQANDVGRLWHDLERSADAAGFALFSESNPSSAFSALLARLGDRPPIQREAVAGELADRSATLRASATQTVLEYALGVRDEGPTSAREAEHAITRYDPSAPQRGKRPSEIFDAVVSIGGVEAVSDADLPWLIDSFFRHARRLVYIRIHDDAEHPDRTRAGVARDRFFWSEQIAAVAAKHPGVNWRLLGVRGLGSRGRIAWARSGGCNPGAPPRAWVLCDDKVGHTRQSVGLAEALGWPFEERQLRFNPLNRISNRLLGARDLGLDRERSDPLLPPWPDLVISTGRRCAPIASWIAKRSGGHTRVVSIGRKGGDIVERVDLSVTCPHFRLLPHRRRIETAAPINALGDAALREAAQRWLELRPDPERGFVGLLVGGSSAQHALDADTVLTIAREVSAFAAAAGRRVVAITSPRTSSTAVAALRRGLGEADQLRIWSSDPNQNPYLGCLALADALVVTGDSESMLGEAAATGKPVYIVPLPERTRRIGPRLGEWVRARAYARPHKRKKGTVRPQQGMEAFFSRLLADGWLRAPRAIGELQRALVATGTAQMFGAPFSAEAVTPVREVETVAQRVWELMGQSKPLVLPTESGPGP